ncbi:LRR repeats and ubiquitin-like domain-containing protein At2g30105 [Phalaenopsis equestris]|uniref:LRR repeats and ubiquitin-like domain-containing protein At2g30105 n=1 Tax=Phalaenopsis equestris TaxID=78828 RepID=UPI0009E574CF|nr:LRR repeats and ubiquitin-like domain-containing protein At2g30105 [Phalaenopsis equestris]XP_020585825.1 LRR repeats and ubiquitin-like domain-containing protein At2g30105 [Phalaenopsis equestris]
MEKTEKSIEAAGGDSQASPSAPSITVNVKFRGEKIPISLSPESTVGDLKSRLQPLTYTPPLAQKLIYKGKVLIDSESLQSLQITSSSKIMMTPSYSQLKADVPLTEPASPAVPNLMTDNLAALSIEANQILHWRIGGVVALGRRQLKDIPNDVWYCALHVRILDVSDNYIQELPEKIGDFKSLINLNLNGNDLSDEKISWVGLTQLKFLGVLSLNSNKLTTLPPALGSLTSLAQLHIANNMLTCLPDELGCLNQLQIFNADYNRISSLPATIGNCSSLDEISISNNFLTELPETIEDLKNLKILRLNNNYGLNSIPSNLFTMCTKLEILRVDQTGITIDHLHQMDGYEEFDARRLQIFMNKLDFLRSSRTFEDHNERRS